MQEGLKGGLTDYYSVAVVKKGTLPDVYHLRDLRNKNDCFACVGSQTGWNISMSPLLKEENLKIVEFSQ